MIKKSSIIVLPILLAVALTGCGKSSEISSLPSAKVSTSPSVDKAAADKAAADKAAADKAAAEKAAAEKAAAEKAAAEKAAAAQPVAAQNDPQFSTCKEAIAAGYGNYTKADPEYSWYQDRDGDGRVCEKK